MEGTSTGTLEETAEKETEGDSLETFKLILDVHAESWRRYDLLAERKRIDGYVHNLIKRVAGLSGQERVPELIDYYEAAKGSP